jgi:UDP-glucose 4-epimerase
MLTVVTEYDELSGATVLITGGSGFIGCNIAHRCVADGARVRVLDCHLPGSGANPANLADIHDQVEFVEGDVRDAELVVRAVAGADVIFHGAAMTSHTRSTEDPLTTLDINARGTINVLEAARLSPSDPKLIHLGTTTQSGPMVREPVDELHPEFPRDMYSATMVGSEKFVLIYAQVHGLRATVVRLCNTYGPRAAIHSADLGFVNYFIGLGLQRKTLTIYGAGEQLRTLLYVDDAVEALILAALNPATDGDVYLASSDRAFTVNEISQAIVRNIGGEISSVPWPKERESIEVGNAVIDDAKIRATLGWQPKVDLPSGLHRTHDYFASRLEAYLGPQGKAP